MAQYSPLSGNGYNHSSQTDVDDDSQPELEKVYRDKSSPSFKSRLSFALLGTLVAAFLVGGIIDALGLTNAEHSKVEEVAPSRIDVKQFAPQSKHLCRYVAQDVETSAKLLSISLDNHRGLFKEGKTDGTSQ